MISLKELQKICHDDATAKGWNDRPITIPEMIALIHSEASEGLESCRKGEPYSFTKDGKPEGLASEFADIIIRIGHYSSHLGIDLEYEVDRKLTYNRNRPYRHGGKVI